MESVVTFGEVMMRLNPQGFLRLCQASNFEVTYAGAEANVAASLARYGISTEFVTCLPDNELGDACIGFLNKHHVGTKHILRNGSRLGIYFLETGSSLRGSKVVYDRADSSISQIKPGMVNWEIIFANAGWFHWTGITPALSQGTAEVCLEALKIARKMGLTVSCDLNYRAKLWNWGKKASEVIPELVGMCDVIIANEEDADKVFGIKSPNANVESGKVAAESYVYVCNEMSKRFPDLKTIGITLRGSLSASHNTWSGLLWDQGEFYYAPVYDIEPIVDRVGGGDSFVGGLIYGIKKYEDRQKTIDFAVAASCLKHTISGDFNQVSVAEVEQLMQGNLSGRVSR